MVLSLHQGMFWEGQACPSQTQVWDGQALGRWLRNAFGTAEYKLFGSWFYEMEHWLKYRSHFGSRYHTRADAVTQAFFPWWVFDSQHHLLSGFQVPMCIQMIHEMAELKAKGPIVCKHPWNKSGTYLSNYRSQFLQNWDLAHFQRRVLYDLLLGKVVWLSGPRKRYRKNCLHFSICACHPCAGAMLIFSVSFQF